MFEVSDGCKTLYCIHLAGAFILNQFRAEQMRVKGLAQGLNSGSVASVGFELTTRFDIQISASHSLS